MKKLILHSIGNQGNYNFYVFDKKKDVAENLSNLFSDIFEINWNFDAPNKKGNYRRFNVERWTDIHQRIDDGKNSKINIFYGKSKMFVTIVCSEKSRLKFNDALLKYFTMPKPKKIKLKRRIKW